MSPGQRQGETKRERKELKESTRPQKGEERRISTGLGKGERKRERRKGSLVLGGGKL